MAYIIQLRRDLASNWTSANTLLAEGEIGYETNTGKLKIGDGVNTWNSLAYWESGASTLPTQTAVVTATGASSLVTGISLHNVSNESILLTASAAVGLSTMTLALAGAVKTIIAGDANVTLIQNSASVTGGTLNMNAPVGINLPLQAGDVISFVNVGGNGSTESGYWRELYRTLHV